MTVSARPPSTDVEQALAYASELLGGEDRRATRMELRAHRMVMIAWPWFAVAQFGLVISVLDTADNSASNVWIPLLVGACAALAFAVLLIASFRFSAIPDDDGSMPASLLESLVIGNATDAPVDQSAMIAQFSARRLQDRRRFNAARTGSLRGIRAAWLWTMLASLAEVAAAVAVMMHPSGY